MLYTSIELHSKFYALLGYLIRSPFSPYLFLMCIKGHLSLIKQAERAGEILEVRIARVGLMVSHLLFANDSLFFAKAYVTEYWILKRIFYKYAATTGQVINLEKSAMAFWWFK